MVVFANFIDRRVKQTIWFKYGLQIGSSVVLLLGGSQKFQPHIRTKDFFRVPRVFDSPAL